MGKPRIAPTRGMNQPTITYETEGHRFESCRARSARGLDSAQRCEVPDAGEMCPVCPKAPVLFSSRIGLSPKQARGLRKAKESSQDRLRALSHPAHHRFESGPGMSVGVTTDPSSTSPFESSSAFATSSETVAEISTRPSRLSKQICGSKTSEAWRLICVDAVRRLSLRSGTAVRAGSAAAEILTRGCRSRRARIASVCHAAAHPGSAARTVGP